MIRITKSVSISQEYPIKEQGLKFPRFLCFWGDFSPIFSNILRAETQDKNTMGNKTLRFEKQKVKMTKKIIFPRFPSFRF